MRIYGDRCSGNCDKVRFTADYLRLPYEWIEADSIKGATRTPAFLAKNPQGQVPLAEFPDGRCLAQSNAIVRRLAEGTRLLPTDAWARAKVDEWMFWEANNFEFFVAGCYGHMTYMGQPKETRDPMRVARGETALDLLDGELRGRQWLIDASITVADVAVLGYARLAHLGGFDIAQRPNLQSWISHSEATLGVAPARAAGLIT